MLRTVPSPYNMDHIYRRSISGHFKNSNLDFVNMFENILLVIIIELDSFFGQIILSDDLILICIWITWMEAFNFDKITLFIG